jgi:protoporphyrinogen oxidase
MTVYILGGGPAGLAVADGLTESGAGSFVLLERGPRLGGLAQTVTWNGVGDHDLGPHKIFTLDQALMQRVESLLPEHDWLTREKISSIFMKGHYLPYPPSPFSLANVFGLSAFRRMVFSYGRARLGGLFARCEPGTFEEDLVGRLGPDLYEILFKPIALKLWGDPRALDVKLSRGRVQTPSLTEVLARLLRLRKSSEFEALTFRYPRRGLSRLWDAIEEKGRGIGQFLCGHTVSGFEVCDGRITTIRCTRAEDGSEVRFDLGEEDYVVSTLPIKLLTRLLKENLPTRLTELAEKVVVLNDLLLVFLHVKKVSLLKESWVFVPDPAIVFHRLSEQESFDPGMTPRGSIVCCEIMSNDMRPMTARSDEQLVAAACKGLEDMGYEDLAVLAHRVIRLPESYPVFRPGYERGLQEIIQGLDGFSNLRTVGRQGAFNYIGTLDAMDIGYGFARWYLMRDRGAWQAERERTSHYPVLD